jgi:hypothetical protein
VFALPCEVVGCPARARVGVLPEIGYDPNQVGRGTSGKDQANCPQIDQYRMMTVGGGDEAKYESKGLTE